MMWKQYNLSISGAVSGSEKAEIPISQTFRKAAFFACFCPFINPINIFLTEAWLLMCIPHFLFNNLKKSTLQALLLLSFCSPFLSLNNLMIDQLRKNPHICKLLWGIYPAHVLLSWAGGYTVVWEVESFMLFLFLCLLLERSQQWARSIIENPWKMTFPQGILVESLVVLGH